MLGTLGSPRLLLRDVTLDDAPTFLELDRDPDVMRFLGGVRAEQTLDDMRALLAQRIAWYTEQPGLGLGVCSLRTTGEHIGWFMLRPRTYRPYHASGELLPPARGAELGYRLARRCWGQGYATEMAITLVRHGLGPLSLPQVVAFADAAHHASIRVLEKAGFSRVGRARFEAEDVELYRATASR